MSERNARLLRKMELNDKRSKKSWNNLTPTQKGVVRKAFKYPKDARESIAAYARIVSLR